MTKKAFFVIFVPFVVREKGIATAMLHERQEVN